MTRTWTPYPYRRPPTDCLCAWLDEQTGARWIGYSHDLPACDLRWVVWRMTGIGCEQDKERHGVQR